MKSKSVFTLSVLSLILQSAPSYADVVYASSNLWRSPVPSEVTVTASPSMDKDFATACSDFQNLIQKYSAMLADPDVAASLKSVLNQARTQPLHSQFPSQTFQGRFKLDIATDGNLLSDTMKGQLSQIAATAQTSDSLPNYTLPPNACYLSSQNFSAGTAHSRDDSLSHAIALAGLSSLPARIEFVGGNGAYLYITGLDTACDLASGKLTFQSQVQASVQLALNQQVSLKSFYREISDIGNTVVEKYHDPERRAAALGFRLGDFFAKSFPTAGEEQVDEMIDGTLDTYFVDGALDLNGLWTPSLTGDRTLEVQAHSSPVTIGLRIERSAQ